MLQPGSRHLLSDSQSPCRGVRLTILIASSCLVNPYSPPIFLLFRNPNTFFYLPTSSDSFLFPDYFFFFPSISSPFFLRRPDFSLHVDSQPGSSLSPLEFRFLDCCQLSTLLLITGVLLSSFHSVFPLPSVTFCFSSLHSFLPVSCKPSNEFHAPL